MQQKLPSIPKTPEQIGMLAHEAVHAAQTILRNTGINDEEFLSLVVGNIVSETLRLVKELKKNRNTRNNN